MAVRISGVLKDGAGKPIQNCTIQLKGQAQQHHGGGEHSWPQKTRMKPGVTAMDVEYGQYSVSLLVEGFPPSHAGIITVYEDSQAGHAE
ncbi:prophage tail fiber N-terminal domain-containing protein [Escherichia coli]